ncbi:hypothetical protein D9M71_187700 [compost metagenome]
MLGAQVAFTQALHDGMGLDATVVHRDAGTAHQVAVAAFVEDFRQLTPEHGNGAAVAVGWVDTGAADFQDRPLQVAKAMQAEFFFAVEATQAVGRLVVEQARRGHQAAAGHIAHADMAAVLIVVVHVQAKLCALQAGVELIAEDVEAQGLGFLQRVWADQAFGV